MSDKVIVDALYDIIRNSDDDSVRLEAIRTCLNAGISFKQAKKQNTKVNNGALPKGQFIAYWEFNGKLWSGTFINQEDGIYKFNDETNDFEPYNFRYLIGCDLKFISK